MGKRKRRIYRDARGRFISRAEWERQQQQPRRRLRGPKRRGLYTSEEEGILEDVRRRLRPARVPEGTEFELTARYKGQRGPGGNGPLDLTMRIVVTRPMTVEEARLLTERAIADGVVPPGLDVTVIDWQKPERDGTYRGQRNVRRALRGFRAVIGASRTRFDRVKP